MLDLIPVIVTVYIRLHILLVFMCCTSHSRGRLMCEWGGGGRGRGGGIGRKKGNNDPSTVCLYARQVYLTPPLYHHLNSKEPQHSLFYLNVKSIVAKRDSLYQVQDVYKKRNAPQTIPCGFTGGNLLLEDFLQHGLYDCETWGRRIVCFTYLSSKLSIIVSGKKLSSTA